MEDPYIVDLGTVPDEDGVVIPPSDTSYPESEVVVIPPAGGVSTTPSTTIETPGQTGSGISTSQAQLSPEVRDLLEELRVLRTEREKAQKSLEELRAWIEQLKSEKN
jgi:hypothetical protein